MTDRKSGSCDRAGSLLKAGRWAAVLALIAAWGLQALAAGPVKGWVVRAEYPVPEAAPGTTDPVYWVFTVLETRTDPDGDEWRISLADREGRALARAEFLYRPARHEIVGLRCWEWRKGLWIETKPLRMTVGEACLLFSGPLPLDLVSLVPLTAAVRERAVILREGAGAWCFTREFLVREEKRVSPANGMTDRFGGGGTLRETVLTDSRDPGRSWRFVQAEGSPWWSRCETPRFRAELVSVERSE